MIKIKLYILLISLFIFKFHKVIKIKTPTKQNTDEVLFIADVTEGSFGISPIDQDYFYLKYYWNSKKGLLINLKNFNFLSKKNATTLEKKQTLRTFLFETQILFGQPQEFGITNLITLKKYVSLYGNNKINKQLLTYLSLYIKKNKIKYALVDKNNLGVFTKYKIIDTMNYKLNYNNYIYFNPKKNYYLLCLY
jgi:hypothetical protein